MWLEWMNTLMGGVSRQAHAATFRPDRFHCLLDELPVHLIPQTPFRAMQSQPECELYLTPHCQIRDAEDLPEEFAEHRDLLSGFDLRGTIAWIRNLPGESLQPFWLGPELATQIRGLRANESVPQSVPAKTRSLLAAAGILVPAHWDETSRSRREEVIRRAGPMFQTKGYAPIGDLIHPLHIASLRRYYRRQIRSGAIPLGDGQSPLRYVGYNEPVARFFHQQIAPTISAIAGEPLKPSYVYMASYVSGADLRKHVDREQCEFSVTLCLDFTPEPKLATPWPIRLDTASGTTTVYQALGDSLAYRGTRLPHYRDRLGPAQTSTSIFFHYVGQDFQGSLD